MMFRLPAKHRGIAYAACVALVAVAAVVMGFKPVARFPVAYAPSAALPEDTETLRAGQAVEDLKRLAELEISQLPAQAAGSERIVALYSPELAATTQSALPALDFSKTSLVILGTRRGTVAIVDGVSVGPGQRLPTGEIVRRIGRTFIVLEDSAGAVRRIDLKDNFGAPSPAPGPLPASPPESPSPATAIPLFPASTQPK